MTIQEAIRRVTERKDLAADEMRAVMYLIMSGQATPAQIGGFLIGLRMKGETVAEIAACAQVMRELATPVVVDQTHLVDTCGTGGDALNTFNISTACAFVVAAAGGRVAKHGNRSVSGCCGSADVLEAAGARIDLDAAQVARCINEVGVGFMFAPLHHSAMKYAIGPRREMGVRTIFNLLGPLTNPAGARRQVLGVFNPQWLMPIAQVLERLGSQHVLVVHAQDGLDEISIGAPTEIVELKSGSLRRFTVAPEDFGIKRNAIHTLTIQSPAASLAMLRAALAGEVSPAHDVVQLNAGAGIYAAGLVDDLAQGMVRASELLAQGEALKRFERYVRFTQAL